ncbi:uncharacterized protein TNCV_3470591 [Trichonephila clavipes]|nr:uncharacterized protein TNCV_3470591 [Trichonephila clavipes]
MMVYYRARTTCSSAELVASAATIKRSGKMLYVKVSSELPMYSKFSHLFDHPLVWLIVHSTVTLIAIFNYKTWFVTPCCMKNVKSGKGPLTPAGLLKLVKRFKETGKLEDRARAGRPCLKEEHAPCIAVEMEAIASEAASGTSSARKATRRLRLPPSSVRNILRRIIQLYPTQLQSFHELLPADTAQREAFAKWAFSKMEQDPT